MKIGTTVEFDAAHFVQTTDTKCKRLHGHRWVVEVIVKGDVDCLGDDGMMIDFMEIKKLIDYYDHKILLPGASEDVIITAETPSDYMNGSRSPSMGITHLNIIVKRKNRNRVLYIFPKDDCVVLENLEVVTAEGLAMLIHGNLCIVFDKFTPNQFDVKVYESPKSWAEA